MKKQAQHCSYNTNPILEMALYNCVMILKGWLEIFLSYLRMIAALAEDLTSVPSTRTGQLATTSNSRSREPAPSSGVHGHTHTG